MTLLRDTLALLHHLPDLIADWCDRQVQAAHWPARVPADDPGQWPNGEMPWCLRCDAAWPCKATVGADKRLTNRAENTST